ncbi:hypothetical protein BGZ63DRAFT_358101 [Mariannaea sp. PMI_226]|nr:hypothetical protein BGZ63DRAFT_358101 [Mariannaea sp. PMI_226]
MFSSTSLPQATLAATILGATAGTYFALSPPNPVTTAAPSTSDSIRLLNLTHRHATKITLAPLGLLAWQSSTLAYYYPNIPASVLGHGAENGLNASLITWSPATCIPLGLIICAGIPLRLVSYGSLGRNFTFALTEPDRLVTTGIYRYVQHPSYTGLAFLIVGNLFLLCRMDGALSCFITPAWCMTARILRWMIAPAFLCGTWVRVQQEELLLRTKFGVEWEKWHARTARFIPGFF